MDAGSPSAGSGTLRWRIIFLFFFATIISYIDRQTLSVNAPLIRHEIGLSNRDYSYLVGAFLVAYTLGPTAAGWLIDRAGVRLGMAVCIAWWSVAGMLHATATGLPALLLFRFLLGLGEAGSVPSTMRAVSEWFPRQERAFATSIFTAGTALGAVVSVPIIAFLTIAVGWRACFVVTGLLGFVWLIPWWRLYAPPDVHPSISTAERRLIVDGRTVSNPGDVIPIGQILTCRKSWGIIAGRMGVDPVWWFYIFWLPTYFADVRGFDLRMIGLLGWLPFLAADGGSLLGGWVSGRLVERTNNLTLARKIVLFAGATGTLAGLAAPHLSSSSASITVICVATFAIGMWAPTVLTLCADILPPGGVGTMAGLSGTGAGIAGILFTLLTGWLVDRYSYLPVFALAGLTPLVGFAALSILVGRVEPIVVTSGAPRRACS